MKVIKAKYTIAIILVCLVFTNCKKKEYAYFKGFSNYMYEEHKVNISNSRDIIYYILPLSDCNSCQGTLLNLEYLSSIKESLGNTILVLVGQTKNSRYKDFIDNLSASTKVLLDADNSIFDYQTGLGKPMLVHIKNGKVEHYLKITDFKIEEAGNYIMSTS